MLFLAGLVIGVVEGALLNGGEICALHSQCKSGSCLGSRCCEIVFPNCNACNIDGTCGDCESGFEQNIYGECVASHTPGSPCVADAFCDSGTCKSNCCSSKGAVSSCVSCNSMNGDCAECKSSYYLDPDTRTCKGVRPIGAYCEAYVLNQCQSKVCRDRCCDTENLDPHCGLCDGNGTCAGCVSGYKMLNNVCAARSLREGRPCTVDSECAENVCLVGVCCSSPGCALCNKYGTCSQCKPGFTLTPEGLCLPPRSFRCARTTRMAEKRYCGKMSRLGERCCWSCAQPCVPGLACQAISDVAGICTLAVDN